MYIRFTLIEIMSGVHNIMCMCMNTMQNADDRYGSINIKKNYYVCHSYVSEAI